MNRLLTSAFIVALPWAGCTCAEPPGAVHSAESSTTAPRREQHVEVTLVLSSTVATPGSTVTVGVRFTIDPGWHIYWNGRNDSGEPPRVTLELPPGVTAGQTRWPAPTRHVLPGGILDHIYEREAVLLIPLTVAPGARPGERVRIGADCSWMVCSDVCLLEKGRTETQLIIGHESPPEPSSAAVQGLRRSEQRVPRAVPEGSKALRVRRASEAAPGSVWVIEAEGARVVEFYPAADCAGLADPIADTRAEGERLTVRLQATQDTENKQLRGVAGVWMNAESSPAYYVVEPERAR